MVQGKDAIEVLEHLIVGDIASLEDKTGTLSVFTNEKGGIIDDSVITRVRSTHIIQCLSGNETFNTCKDGCLSAEPRRTGTCSPLLNKSAAAGFW